MTDKWFIDLIDMTFGGSRQWIGQRDGSRSDPGFDPGFPLKKANNLVLVLGTIKSVCLVEV